MDVKLFVIVVAYKGKQWYDRCFGSLRKSTMPVQTVVVDNASSDGSAEYIREHYPEIHLIESNENLGFGRANNLAMRYALDNGCDYVFLLNQDTCIEPSSITELVELHRRHKEYGILSPMHLTGDMQHLNILFNDGTVRPNYEIVSDLYFGKMKELYDMAYVNAAAWLLPRATLETVGGFNPIFKQYSEDDDYMNRVRFHGLKIGLCPSVKIVHDHTDLLNPFDANNQNYRHEQLLALEHVDPNSDYSVNQHLRYLCRKVITSLIKGDRQMAKRYRADFHYLSRMKTQIETSRRESMLKKASWL